MVLFFYTMEPKASPRGEAVERSETDEVCSTISVSNESDAKSYMATPHPTSLTLGHLPLKGKAFRLVKGERNMKATGIVRRVDNLGRIVIPKEIRRTLKIREGVPPQTTLIPPNSRYIM